MRPEPLSLWRLQRILGDILRQTIVGPLPLARLVRAKAELYRHLCDAPRRRVRQTTQALRNFAEQS